MSDRLILDYTNMMAPRLGGRGLDPALLDDPAFTTVHAKLEKARTAGEIGFMKLP